MLNQKHLLPFYITAAFILFPAFSTGGEVFDVQELFELDTPVEGTGGGPFTDPQIAASKYGALLHSFGYALAISPDTEKTKPVYGIYSTLISEAATAWNARDPIVASNGETYLIALETSNTETGYYSFVYLLIDAITLEPIGKVGFIDPCQSSGDNGSDLAIAATKNGNYIAVWQGEAVNGTRALLGARIDGASGILLDPEEGFLIVANESLYKHNVSGNETSFLVVWSFFGSEEVIKAARIDPLGQKRSTDPIEIASGFNYLVEFKSTAIHDGFLVFWSDSGATNYLRAVTIKDGEAAPSEPIVVTSNPNEKYIRDIHGSSSMTEALITWQEEATDNSDGGDIYSARIETTNQLQAGQPVVLCDLSSAQERPQAAFMENRYLVVWQDYRVGAWHVYGSTIEPSTGVSTDPEGIPILVAANDQSAQQVAGSEHGFTVTWTDSRFGPETSGDIMGTVVSLDGEPVSETATVFHNGAGSDSNRATVFFNDAMYTVWLKDEYDPNTQTASIGLARSSPVDGAVLSENTEVVPGMDGVYPEVSLTSSLAHAVLTYTADSEIKVAYVEDPTNPVVIDPPIYATPEPPDPDGFFRLDEIQTASFENTLFVLWEEHYSQDSNGYFYSTSIRGQLFDVSGASTAVPEGDIIEFSGIDPDRYVLVGHQDEFLILWPENDLDSDQNSDLMAQSVPRDPQAELPGPTAILENVYVINSLMASPFEEGIFVFTRSYVPIEDMNAYEPTHFGVLFDTSLDIRVEPTILSDFSWLFSAGTYGDKMLVVVDRNVYSSSRLFGSIITVVEGDPGDTDDTDSGDDTDDTDNSGDTDDVDDTDDEEGSTDTADETDSGNDTDTGDGMTPGSNSGTSCNCTLVSANNNRTSLIKLVLTLLFEC